MVEDVDCETQHMDLNVTCLNRIVFETFYVGFMLFKGLEDRVPDTPIYK